MKVTFEKPKQFAVSSVLDNYINTSIHTQNTYILEHNWYNYLLEYIYLHIFFIYKEKGNLYTDTSDISQNQHKISHKILYSHMKGSKTSYEGYISGRKTSFLIFETDISGKGRFQFCGFYFW